MVETQILTFNRLLKMVLRQDQAYGGREEAVAAAERARRLPHQGLGVEAKRLFSFHTGRRHRQALQDQAARRGRFLHSEEDNF